MLARSPGQLFDEFSGYPARGNRGGGEFIQFIPDRNQIAGERLSQETERLRVDLSIESTQIISNPGRQFLLLKWLEFKGRTRQQQLRILAALVDFIAGKYDDRRRDGPLEIVHEDLRGQTLVL